MSVNEGVAKAFSKPLPKKAGLYKACMPSASQKEEKIRAVKAKLAERDNLKGGGGGSTEGSIPKDSLIVADFVTGEGTSDSAIGGGISVYTRSSRASGSDFEFSESYL
jgi:gamma-aminobutyric acid type B receptor